MMHLLLLLSTRRLIFISTFSAVEQALFKCCLGFAEFSKRFVNFCFVAHSEFSSNDTYLAFCDSSTRILVYPILSQKAILSLKLSFVDDIMASCNSPMYIFDTFSDMYQIYQKLNGNSFIPLSLPFLNASHCLVKCEVAQTKIITF